MLAILNRYSAPSSGDAFYAQREDPKMTTFAALDHSNLEVVTTDPDGSHTVVADLGTTFTMREATAKLRAAGFNPLGRWRDSNTGLVRTLNMIRMP